MKRPKVLIVRHMPYTTMLNRGRMYKELGWEIHLLHDQVFANSGLMMACARTFDDIFFRPHTFPDPVSADDVHDFVRRKGYDLVYTIGPPDEFMCHFTNCPTAWIHDVRDLLHLTTPHTDKEEEREHLIQSVAMRAQFTTVPLNACDLAVFVTPWQRERAWDIIFGATDVKPSIWLPNVPWKVPDISERAPRDDTVRWGYTGSMTAAWMDAPRYAGEIAHELERLGYRHQFHHWSFGQRKEYRPMEWWYQHDSLEQNDMIVDMARHVRYGIVMPGTRSDGLNAPTGWPGKLGDYIAAGLTVLVPAEFMTRTTVIKNGWGLAYETARDIATFMSAGREPTEKRRPPLELKAKTFMRVLDLGTQYALAAFKKRWIPPVRVAGIDTRPKMLVVTDGNFWHARMYAEMLGADFGSRIATVEGIPRKERIDQYEDLFLVGVWPDNDEGWENYRDMIRSMKRGIIYWAGSDANLVPHRETAEKAREILCAPHLVHVAPTWEVAQRAEAFVGRTVHTINTPSTLVYEKPFDLPRKFAVSVYYNTLNREVYGCDILDEVFERMPNTTFYLHAAPHISSKTPDPQKVFPNAIWLKHIPKANYPEFLKQVSVFLRMTTRDGVPFSMVEHLCAGRRAIVAHDYSFTHRVKRDPLEIVKKINRLRNEREIDQAATEYWRTYNDFDRFRNCIDGLLEHAAFEVNDHAESTAS